MKNNYAILTFYTSWCGLGFIRGANSYKYEKKEKNLYVDLIKYGLFGTIMYANPALFPIFIYKELYRLEINMRNLEDEKKNRYYNTLL